MALETGEVLTRFAADTSDIDAAFAAMRNKLNDLAGDTQEVGKTSSTAAETMGAMGGGMMKAGAVISAAMVPITGSLSGLGAMAVNTAIKYESSFAGVRKTVDGTKAELNTLAQQLREMSMVMPVSTQQLNSIAEIAGQLGIAKEAVAPFVKTVADMSASTNLSAEAAANAFARIGSIMGLTAPDFAKLGSAVVDLGNKGSSTETEIVNMAMRIAGAAAAAGIQTDSMLGLAAALANVGIRAEAGGTSMSKLIMKIAGAVSAGGDELDQFAKVAGVSADSFAEAFREDGAMAIGMFIQGLGNIKEAGGSVFATLDEMGLSEIRLRDALLRTSAAAGDFTETLDIGHSAWQQSTALATEAGKRYETTASQMTVMQNRLNDISLTIGTAFLPMINSMLSAIEPIIKVVAGWAQAFAELSPTTQAVIGGIVVFTAVIGPLIVAAGAVVSGFAALLPLIGGIGTAIRLLPAAFAIAKTAFTAMSAVLLANPWVLVATAVAALAVAIFMNWDRIETATSAAWQFIKDTSVTAWNALKSAVIEIVTGLYQGVKNQLVNKMTGLLDPVKNFAKSFISIFQTAADEVVHKSIVPEMVEDIGYHMSLLDRNMTAPARTAARGTYEVFRELLGEMSGITKTFVQTTLGAMTTFTSQLSGALAKEIISTNNWKETMRSMGETVLATFINMGIQMMIAETARALFMTSSTAATEATKTGIVAAGEATRTGLVVAASGTRLATDTATATASVSIWGAASTMIVGFYASVASGFAAISGALVGVITAVGTFVMGVLSAIAAALTATVFGIPWAGAILAGVVLIGLAIAAASGLMELAEGGIVTSPTMALIGEKGPEAVIPLNKITNVLGSTGAPGAAGPTQQTVIVELDGRTIARAVTKELFPVLRVQGVNA